MTRDLEDHAIWLGVNIDHVATLRQSRGTRYPDPIQAAFLAESGGADGITVHLREDRRHIQERDVRLLREVIHTRLNLEMAATSEMVAFAGQILPEHCCLVPERRAELTTEGGLDVVSQLPALKDVCAELAQAGIMVSLFIDPDPAQIEAAAQIKAPVIEIHTGRYASATTPHEIADELERITQAVDLGVSLGLQVNAGHGLNYRNVASIARLRQIKELNIGHAIVAQALLTGMEKAVVEMKKIMQTARAEVLQSLTPLPHHS